MIINQEAKKKVPGQDQVGSPLVGSPPPMKNRNQENHQVMKAEIHQRTGAKVLELKICTVNSMILPH